MYEQTIHGKMRVGTILITINDGQIDINKYTNLSLEELTEVNNASSFDAFDFPLFEYEDTHMSVAEQSIMQPSIDLPSFSNTQTEMENDKNLQADQPASQVPLDMIHTINIEPNETDGCSDFAYLVDNFDADEVMHFDAFQDAGLMEDMNAYENEFVPINHPVCRAGVQVNRKGEIILQNNDEEAMKTLRIREMDPSYEKVPNKNNNLHLISKENKLKVGPVFAFDIYRNGTWLKACDFHLATEVIKTFVPRFQKDEIEVIYYDGNSSNCHLHNLVAKVKRNDRLNASPMNVVLSNDWKQCKSWNGELLPNFFSSLDGSIIHVSEESIIPKKIGAQSTCYNVNMHGMRFDARKVVWRSFTNEEPEYSESHYRVHIVDKTKQHHLSINNLIISLESSTFDQWTKENEAWPWKRSSKGNVPKHLRVKTKKRIVKKQAVKTNTDTAKKRVPQQPKSQHTKRSKVNKTSETQTPTPTRSVAPSKPSPRKQRATAQQFLAKKKVKLMSETKFKQLQMQIKMNLTTTKKDRELYKEQRVLRDLKKFLG